MITFVSNGLTDPSTLRLQTYEIKEILPKFGGNVLGSNFNNKTRIVNVFFPIVMKLKIKGHGFGVHLNKTLLV